MSVRIPLGDVRDKLRELPSDMAEGTVAAVNALGMTPIEAAIALAA